MTVREPVALIETNLRWHSQLGAEALHVFFDDPADPAADALPDLPGLRAIRCDAGFWRRRR
ncbi:MAG: glycosyltransferase family 2 protein, partial [Pseudomonadota bacterium]